MGSPQFTIPALCVELKDFCFQQGHVTLPNEDCTENCVHFQAAQQLQKFYEEAAAVSLNSAIMDSVLKRSFHPLICQNITEIVDGWRNGLETELVAIQKISKELLRKDG